MPGKCPEEASMNRNQYLFFIVVLTFLLVGITACTPQEQAPDGDNGDNGDNPQAVETAGEDDAPNPFGEVLFDGESVPGNWPVFLSMLPEMMVTEYTNTNESVHAFGYVDHPIDMISPWIQNYFVSNNALVDWLQDPDNLTVDVGSEQIYYLLYSNWALAIELKAAGDNRCTFDYTLTRI